MQALDDYHCEPLWEEMFFCQLSMNMFENRKTIMLIWFQELFYQRRHAMPGQGYEDECHTAAAAAYHDSYWEDTICVRYSLGCPNEKIFKMKQIYHGELLESKTCAGLQG